MVRVDSRRTKSRPRSSALSYYPTYARHVIDQIEYELHAGLVIKYANEILDRHLHLTRGSSLTCHLIHLSRTGALSWPKYFCYARSVRGTLIGYAYLICINNPTMAPSLLQFGVYVHARYRCRGIAAHLIRLLATHRLAGDLTIIADKQIVPKVRMFYPGRTLIEPTTKYFIVAR
jgi:GNAT superfamily N-acetyltransferase